MNVGSVEMMGTLKPYLLQKILFELFALTGRRGYKNFGHKC